MSGAIQTRELAAKNEPFRTDTEVKRGDRSGVSSDWEDGSLRTINVKWPSDLLPQLQACKTAHNISDLGLVKGDYPRAASRAALAFADDAFNVTRDQDGHWVDSSIVPRLQRGPYTSYERACVGYLLALSAIFPPVFAEPKNIAANEMTSKKQLRQNQGQWSTPAEFDQNNALDVNYFSTSSVSEEKRTSTVNTPTLSKETTTVIKREQPKSTLAVGSGFLWPELVQSVFSNIDSGHNMDPRADYFTLAGMAADTAGDDSFRVDYDATSTTGTLVSKFRFKNKSMCHPDPAEVVRHLGWRYLREIRKQVMSTPAAHNDRVEAKPTEPARIFSTVYNDTRMVGCWCWGSYAMQGYQSMLIDLSSSSLGRGSGMAVGSVGTPSDYAFVGDVFSGGFSQVNNYAAYLENCAWKRGGIVRVRLHAIVMHAAGQSQTNVQFALARVVRGKEVTDPYELRAYAVTPVSYNASYPTAPTTGTPTQRNSVSCTLMFPPLSGAVASGDQDAVIIGCRVSQNETTMQWPVGAPERYWPYQFEGPARPQVDFHITLSIEYVPPEVPLSLSGDIELNPGPMTVVLTDGAISDVMTCDQTRDFLEKAILRKTPPCVWKGLTIPGMSGPDIVSWAPDDSIKQRAVEKKIHPTGNKRPDAVLSQREAKLTNGKHAMHRPDPDLDDFAPGWHPGQNSGKPVGVCDVTPATQIKSVLQRVSAQIRGDEDYVLWLLRRRPTISWAMLVGGYCKLGVVGQVAMELYRGKFCFSLWPSVYCLRACDYGATFASLLFDSIKSERTLAESVATLIDLLSNAERLENPLLDSKKMKYNLSGMANSWLKETPLSDGQIEIPSIMKLVCVELNPGPTGTIHGFPAGRHPTVDWLHPTGQLLGGSDEKYMCTPSDVPSLLTLKPAGGESWSPKDVAAHYVSMELPNRGTDIYSGDGFTLRTVSSAAAVSNVNTTPREAFGLYRLQTPTVYDSKQGPTFIAVGTLPNKQDANRWTKSATADDFLMKLLGPVAGRADRAIWFGFRYADVALWLNTIMTQQEAKYTISTASIPSSSYYLNYLRVTLALVPKVLCDQRYPAMSSEYGVASANQSSFVYSLSYNNGLATYGELIALGSPAFASGNNRFSLWASADQASVAANGVNLLPVPSQLIAAATSDTMANKFLALFLRMWAAAPSELAFISRPGAGADIRRSMCTSSMVAVQGGIDDLRVVLPLRQASGLPADAAEAREQCMMTPTTPAGIAYNFSVAAPTWLNLAGYLTEWIAVTTADEVVMFLNIMATLTSSLKDMNAALHDAFAISARYTQGYVDSFPAFDTYLTNALSSHWGSYGGVDQAQDTKEAPFYPANPDNIEVAFWGHQTPISTFALQVFGMISDSYKDTSTLRGFNTVSEMARYARYPARACAVANHPYVYCTDLTPSIFDNADSDSGLSQYLTFLYKTHCSGDGRVVWPIRERLYGAIWGTLPPKDKLGLNMLSRIALNFNLELMAPTTNGAGAFADNYNAILLPDSHLGPLRKLGPLFEHFKPALDIMNAKLKKDADAVTTTQSVWIDVINTNTRRLVAPIRPENTATFVLGDEFASFSQYERQVFRLASASEMPAGAPFGSQFCFVAADQTDLPTYTLLANDITPRFATNGPVSALVAWNGAAVSRTTYCVPKIVRSTSASPQLVRVYLTFSAPQTEIGAMTGAKPYTVLTIVDFAADVGNMLNLRTGGTKLSDLKMSEDDDGDAGSEKASSVTVKDKVMGAAATNAAASNV